MATPQHQEPQGPLHSTKSPVIGVLLVHGLNGCQSDMAEIEEVLQARGIITTNMLLPGHGVHVRELVPLGWEDWAQAVREELKLLKQRCDVVFLVGHSLGGALSLHVAAHEEVAGIVSMCAPLHMHPWLKPMVGFIKYFTPLFPTLGDDVRNREVRRQLKRDVYRWTPLSPVYSMLQFLPKLREELPQINAPALIMTSKHDHVVPARDGHEIYRRIGSREKYLITFHRSYHMVMVDHDREEVIAKTAAFILRLASKARPHSSDVSSTNQTA
jgi:carboxylesterase